MITSSSCIWVCLHAFKVVATCATVIEHWYGVKQTTNLKTTILVYHILCSVPKVCVIGAILSKPHINGTTLRELVYVCMYVCMVHPSSLHYCHAMTLTWTDHASDTCSLTMHTHDFVSTALIDQLNEPIQQDEFFNRPERTKDPKEMIARESNGKSA